jgi:inhibitor of KinA sporulation pathway (predicted exonuclease)
MAPPLRIAIIDLECTCDDKILFQTEDYEIIEVGVSLCELSIDDLKIIDSMQIYVKPLVRPILTTFCTELTGIKQTTVDQSNILADALPIVDKWMNENNVEVWGSWGNDRKQFIIECRLKSLVNPMEKIHHFDIKRIFSELFGWRVGMTRAMQLRGVVSEGRLHSGVDDARNVARLVKKERTIREAILHRVKSVKEELF